MPAEPLADTLIARLREHFREGAWDEATRQRLQAEAEALHAGTPALRQSLRGMAAALREEPERMREHHRAALRAAPEAARPYGCYAASLALLGFIEEAAATAAQGAQLAPDDPEALLELLARQHQAGRLGDAAATLERLEGLAPHAYPLRPWREPLTAAREALQASALPEGALQEAVQLTCTVLHEAGCHLSRLGVRAVAHEGGEWLYIGVALLGRGPETAAALDERLAERIAEQGERYPALLQGALIAGFEPGRPATP